MGCTASHGAHGPNIQKPEPEEGRTHCGHWIKHADDLVDFPKFPAGYTQSLVCQYLTKEIWDEYKDKKDDMGVSFKTCIVSGCQNVDSGIGCYAGSHSSYKAFPKFFDRVIEHYHKHGPSANHVSDMDAASLVCPPLPEDEAKMIKSTRIRVGRNLAEYPLGPGITKEQREEIMNKVVTACNTFEGDLAGSFYPLETMSAKDRNQLIADHFLFK
jgi:hypothetical protein